MKELIQCGNCAFFRVNPANGKDKELHQQRGTCHKRPPQGKAGFPSVSGADFCGECVEGTCPFEGKNYATCFGHASTRAQG